MEIALASTSTAPQLFRNVIAVTDGSDEVAWMSERGSGRSGDPRDPDQEAIGRRFRVAREAAGLTQAAAADALGVQPSVLSRYENGLWFPKVALLRRIARLYGVSVDTLIGHDEGPEDQGWPEGVQFIRRASKDLTPEAKQAIMRAMEAILEMDRKTRDKDQDGGPR